MTTDPKTAAANRIAMMTMRDVQQLEAPNLVDLMADIKALGFDVNQMRAMPTDELKAYLRGGRFTAFKRKAMLIVVEATPETRAKTRRPAAAPVTELPTRTTRQRARVSAVEGALPAAEINAWLATLPRLEPNGPVT